MYDKRLNVKLALDIHDGEKPFNSATVEWFDVPYGGVLEIQKNLLVFLKTMNELGYEVDKVGGMKPGK